MKCYETLEVEFVLLQLNFDSLMSFYRMVKLGWHQRRPRSCQTVRNFIEDHGQDEDLCCLMTDMKTSVFGHLFFDV